MKFSKRSSVECHAILRILELSILKIEIYFNLLYRVDLEIFESRDHDYIHVDFRDENMGFEGTARTPCI